MSETTEGFKPVTTFTPAPELKPGANARSSGLARNAETPDPTAQNFTPEMIPTGDAKSTPVDQNRPFELPVVDFAKTGLPGRSSDRSPDGI